jgi:NAD(P)-dependent dehydrogenase (short-subunit alcohol dehydrogenase family)
VFEPNFFGLIAVTQAMLPLLKLSKAGRIVNMSSALGSLGMQADPNSGLMDFKPLGYASSKATVNMLTIFFAHELRDTPIKVNSASPGWVKTDMGGAEAPGTAEEGADTPVWLATLPADGPTGGFFQNRKPLPW